MRIGLVAVLLAGVSIPAAAETSMAVPVGDPVPAASSKSEGAISSRFAPRGDTLQTRIDYKAWDEALAYFVFYMGPSERRIMPKVAPETGTRMVFGHDSGLRLEGNRVGFSFLEDAQREALTAYREELEALGSQLDIASLPRNEQLAYWLNLHNVAVIEQIALAYPVSRPSELRIGADQLPLDEAKFLNVDGVALSLKDIRTQIVYPNWRDPRVIYGFFRGEIGGPTIQRNAFNAENVNLLLQSSATDFVNSMRGVEKRGNTLHISRLYEEAMPFFFGEEEALRAHLKKFARDDLREDIARTQRIRTSLYEYDVSDLARGERSPEYHPRGLILDPYNYGTDTMDAPLKPIGVASHIARVVEEKIEKMERMRQNGELRGRVIVIDPSNPEATELGREVD
ncbi:DUF547 domain-containing protein [Qipengyuania sp. 1XM1-15A]|uniref:DUF547 domain-containing protein n=1 Tax=Qipengyuania xiamenensis TaxID=2867237 RepID=UPI001C875989|nr:DUF547 domain-containing protein [Qipengyuania xiamenensis]MBX7533583.1 DUF547 domain-containing protein [Qipengyuania xiamenensis]